MWGRGDKVLGVAEVQLDKVGCRFGVFLRVLCAAECCKVL